MIKKSAINLITKESIIQGITEFGRIALIAVLPVIIGQIQVGGKIDYKVIVVVGVIALLKALDKTLHEQGKATDNESLEKGLTRF